MNLLTMLLGSFASDASVNSLSHKTGVSSSMLTKLIPLAIPILLKALTNNASSAGGAQSLLTALGQHSNKRSMAQQIDEVDEKDGEKIVHHILGKDSDQVVRALSRETGMKDEEVTRSLGAMAPALMSALSAAATSASKPAVDLSDGLDFSDLCGLFSGASTAQTQNNVSNMFGSLLGGPQQPQNNGGGLLGALLGGGQPAQPMQQPKPQNNGGSLLGALLGGGQPVQQQPQNNGGGLLGALLGGGQPAQPMQQPKPQFLERFWAAASLHSRCSSRSLRTTAAFLERFWAAASRRSRCSSRIRQRTFWAPFLAARREAGWMTEASF